MRKVSGLFLLLLAQQGCVHDTPKPLVVEQVTVVEDDAPRYVSFPANIRDRDLLCLDVNEPGTCATWADVKQFLVSKKAE